MKIKELLIGAGAGLLGGYILDNFLKSSKRNYAGAGSEEAVKEGEQTVQFTISNSTNSAQQINLFDSYINYVNPNVSISPSMQTFNTYLPTQPMKVISIQVQSQGTLISQEEYLKYAEAVGLTPPETASFDGNWKNFDVSNAQNLGNGFYLVKDKQNAQANQQFQKVCIDASGNQSTESISPTISPLQAQSGNTIVKPKKLILDGKCYLTYSILPKQYLFITMTYIEYEVK
jgi:hypothetical protein